MIHAPERNPCIAGHSKKVKGAKMDTILADLEHALRMGSYYSAVAVSLTLPDVCAALA